jgi:hypothetical protein
LPVPAGGISCCLLPDCSLHTVIVLFPLVLLPLYVRPLFITVHCWKCCCYSIVVCSGGLWATC